MADLIVRPAVRDVVCVSGWSVPATVYDPLCAALSEDWRVTRHDIPAGKSLDDTAKALLANSPPRAVWVGWSLGGMIALRAAHLEPTRVDALVLLATNPCFVAREGWLQAMPAAEFTDFLQRFTDEPRATRDRFDTLMARGGENPRADLRRLRALRDAAPDACNDVEVALNGLQVLRAADLRRDLPQLSCPSHWLYAGADALVPPAVANDIARLLPHAKTGIIAKTNHLLPWHAVTEICAALSLSTLETE